MSGFTKLWAEITDSSIWNEDDKTRIVWITMLARMGPDYVVRASVGGLAHLARVSREDCEKALEKLASPDPDSRSPEEEGRRIKKVEGGFFMINGEKFRQRRGDEEKKAYMREYMRQYRKNKASNVKNVNICKPESIQEEEEAEEEAEEYSLSKERGAPSASEREIPASQTDFAEIPTLEEVIAEAEVRGIPDEHARSFWEYNESKQLWVNQYGKMIKWKMALKSWSERRRTMQPNGKQSTGYKKIEI
jgi:hypothetical protein